MKLEDASLCSARRGNRRNAAPEDLSKSMILVATPEVVDQLYGSTILVVTPVGDQHAGFTANRPTNVTLVASSTASDQGGDPVHSAGRS